MITFKLIRKGERINTTQQSHQITEITSCEIYLNIVSFEDYLDMFTQFLQALRY